MACSYKKLRGLSSSFTNHDHGLHNTHTCFLMADYDVVKFGFQRPEVGTERLAGTVLFHERHVFLRCKGPVESWPSQVEAQPAESGDSLPHLLDAAMKARKPDLKKTTKLTFCEAVDGDESSNGAALVFPDMIRYRGLNTLNVGDFVEEVLVKDTNWLPGSPEAMRGSYVFVCCHRNRDMRCGVCGPVLIQKFKEEIEGQGLGGQVTVNATSHLGGHKFAGNVVIYSPDAKGEATGHWYGYVTPEDVPVLLQTHIGQGKVVDNLWRGQMGLSQEEQKKALELRSTKLTQEGSSANEATGCCLQGSGNFTSCCQIGVTSEQNQKSTGKEDNK